MSVMKRRGTQVALGLLAVTTANAQLLSSSASDDQVAVTAASVAPITVKQFEFEGNEQIASGILSMMTAGYTQRPLSRAMLDEAAGKITQLYKRRGFAKAFVLIPEQDLATGTVRIVISEQGERILPLPTVAPKTAVVPLLIAAPTSPAMVQAPKPAPEVPAAPLPVGTIVVDRFEFEGNTLFTTEQLAGLIAEYAQRPITVSEIYAAADKVGRFYTRQGYKLASVAVPAQKVNQGSVRLKVIEGRIGIIKYEGLKAYDAADLNPYVMVADNRPYEAATFEQNLRRIDALPGLDVRARLQPGAEFGTSDIVVLAQETRLQGSLFVDNAGTQNIGVLRGGAQATLNNPLGFSDQLTLLGLRSEGGLLNYGSATYSLPTGLRDARLSLTYGYAQFDVGGAFAGVGGSNRNLRGEVSLPVRNTSQDQISLTTAVSNVSADTDFAGITFNKSNVTVMEIGGSITRHFSRNAVTQAALVLTSNFEREQKAGDLSKVPFKIDLDVQQIQPLPYALQLLTRGQFVYSPEVLPDTQKYSMGGPNSVRAYAPAETRGDWGYLGQVALRRAYFMGATQWVPRLFYDFGQVRQHQNRFLPAGSRPPDVLIAGYGIGVDTNYRGFSLKLDYAMPTGDQPASDNDDDGRFYGTFAFSF